MDAIEEIAPAWGSNFHKVKIRRLRMIYVLLHGKNNPLVHFSHGAEWVRPWLKECLGVKSPEFTKLENGLVVWILPKSKIDERLRILIASGEVEITQTYTKFSRCNDSCKKAQSDICECSCLGVYHGHEFKEPDFIIPMEEIQDIHMHGEVREKITHYVGGKLQNIDVNTDGGIVNLFTAS
ncbi:hypothetical protein [Micrococcus sp. UYEF12]|uniref:hypothetical protein n=1 Tax=Micrococcus sp. UYEF12 TaxID=1756388 RepID=UPI003392B3DB